MFHRGGVLKTAMILAAACLASVGWPVAGQKTKPKMAVGPFTGMVVDPAGRPAAGVKVRLVAVDFEEKTTVLAEVAADDQGRFQIAEIEVAFGPRTRPLSLVARDARSRVGGSPYLQTRTSGRPAQDRITITLLDVQEYRGRLIDTSGQPIAKATVKPLQWASPSDRDRRSESLVLPPGTFTGAESQTAADGTFVLRGVPSQGRIAVAISGQGFGAPIASMNLGKPATVRLGRVGRVSGTITCAKDPAAPAGIRIRLSPAREPNQAQPAQDEVRIHYSKEGTSSKDGAFRFDDVPPGKYELAPDLPDLLPFFAELLGEFQVKPNETTSVAIALQPAITVKGKVVDKHTGAGIAGVRVNFYIRENTGPWFMSKNATTDSQGAFVFHIKPGKAMVSTYGFPEQYRNNMALPYRGPSQEIEITKDTTLPPIQLERMNVVEGIVVDFAGKPVAGAEIRYMAAEGGLVRLYEKIRSDAAGRFSLKQLSPKQTIIVRARTDKAASDSVNVLPAEVKEPIRLVVSETKTFVLRGLLVDDSGRPFEATDVNVHAHWRVGRSGVGFQLASVKTDAEGRFAIGGLWPGDGYNLRIAVEGCDKFDSREIEGEPGKVRDVGKIVLARPREVVAGTVIDSANKPIAEVRVFNSGDGPEPISTRTDAAGRFRLAGFRSGPVFVFAERKGYRFGGLLTASGTVGVSLKMLRNDEPLPPHRSRTAPLSEEKQRRQARKFLERLWSTGDQSDRSTAVAWIARMDLEQARKWSAESGGKFDRDLLPSLVEKAAKSDLDEALSLLLPEGPNGADTLMKLAKSFAVSDPPKTRRCLEEAVVRARGLDQPQRTVTLARAGAMLMRLGDAAGGRNIIEEAAEMAAKMGTSENGAYARASAAAALTTFDFQRAVGLLESIKDREQRDNYRTVAASLTDDVNQVETLLRGANAYHAELVRIRLARRIAARNPAEAVRYVDQMRGSQYTTEDALKTYAFGWLAATIARRDKDLAFSLIDRAFAICTAAPHERISSGRGDRSTRAAFLTAQAAQIGYPDMESLTYRTLALRPTSKDVYNSAAAVESSATIAMFLALVDADLAGQLLKSIEPRSDLIGSGHSGVGRETWLKAWALVDPEHATELIDRHVASAKDKAEKEAAEETVGEVLALWTLPFPEQLRELARHFRSALPDEEF